MMPYSPRVGRPEEYDIFLQSINQSELMAPYFYFRSWYDKASILFLKIYPEHGFYGSLKYVHTTKPEASKAFCEWLRKTYPSIIEKDTK